MEKILLESIIVGAITSILGNLIVTILVKYNSLENNDIIDSNLTKYKNTYIIQIALFLTGILIHLLLEYIGLEKWYCQKVCLKDKCKIVCQKNLN